MQPLAHLFGLILLALSLTAHASVETWENNLIIDLPKGHDVMTADWNELQCLAANIYHEARGKPHGTRTGGAGDGQPHLQRPLPRQRLWVVRQSYQFSWTHDGRSDQPTDVEAYEKAFKIAIKYLYLGHRAKVDGAELLLNYHADHVEPDWHNLEVVHTEGRHLFYRPHMTDEQLYAHQETQIAGDTHATYDRYRRP